MSYITNIDTLSALLDRLISENIKLYFFKKEGVDENIEHQEKLISEIKERLFILFDDVYETGKYDYIYYGIWKNGSYIHPRVGGS